ncbi:MAG: glucose 1-dehydrogenase [Proteobacteria bacterium]|jgi:NAD(P)-dependent dehydrogenase (short-subunit alcohol dehydrogenase family)|nr:glucose 1-dehydrogenase [Pseudomonadota bacterium]MBT6350164.1 glucose 1-dehydrogenase [Pseudomonadota bacterium]
MSGQLSGRVAIVTGGAGGIGSRIAKEFASQGARVVVASRGQEKLDKIVAEIKSVGGEALGVATDVTDPAQVDNMVSRTISEFGQVDIMVNNAGGAMFIKPAEELLPEEWNAAIALNLNSVFLCSVAVSKNMIERKFGKIINISSVAGMRLSPNFVHYGAAKAAVINLTKGLAVSWGPHNINVNCIAPGLTATEGVANWLPPKTKKDGSPVPLLQYPPDPEHVAQLALFLASSASDRISGELFPIRALTELA